MGEKAPARRGGARVGAKAPGVRDRARGCEGVRFPGHARAPAAHGGAAGGGAMAGERHDRNADDREIDGMAGRIGTLEKTVYRQLDMNHREMDKPKSPAASRSRKPADLDLFPYESSLRPVAALAVDYEDGHRVRRHRHRRSQLVYAISGVMVVDTDAGIWVVPPTRGVWVPAWVSHAIRMSGEPRMRTVFVEPGAAAHLPTECCVLSISPLLRELMVAAAEVPLDWQPGTRDGRLMMLLLDELKQEPVLPLHLPQPSEPRLARICRAIVRHPERQAGAADWARELGVDPKTVHRLFLRHTGMTFGRWRQQARLLAAMERLARGERVLDVALDLGYDSPSAFAAMFRKALGEPPSAFAARGTASA